MAHSIKNPLLVKTKDAVETKLPAELKEPVERIVLAGQKLLYNPDTHEQIVKPLYEKVQANGFKPDEIANGMVNLLGMLYQASNKGMQVEAAYPAGVILLCYVLDDLEQMHGLTVDQGMLKAIGSVMLKQFVKAFGLKNGDEAPTDEAPAATPEAAPAPQGGMAQQGVM